MNLRGLIQELKRRRVLRVAGVYVVVAWAAVEGAATTFPLLGLPEWTPTLVLALCLLGFPVAVALAWAFDLTSQGIQRTTPGEPQRSSGRSRALVAVAAVGLLAGVGGYAVWARGGEPERPLDPELVAVFPFRVSADPSFGYLREGVVDLLATKLTGGVGPRALDARTAMSAWKEAAGSVDSDLEREDALALARRLGAGQLLLGTVVGTPGALTLNGILYDVATGEERVRATDVRGPPEELTGLVDRLAGELLALEAGVSSQQLASLTSTSFPALKLYLEGKRAYRHGRFAEGAAKLDEAVVLDSTFTLAAMEYLQGSGWGDLTTDNQRSRDIRELAIRHADRLSEKDRAYFDARHGPVDGPEQKIQLSERVVRVAPEKPEGWYHLGLVYAHGTHLMGVEGSLERGRTALERALELDPTYAVAIEYLMRIAMHQGDLESFRDLGERYLEVATAGEHAEYIRWWLAAGAGDPATLARVRAGMDSLSLTALGFIWGSSLTFGLEVRDAERAIEILERRARTEEERGNYWWRAVELYGNQGRYARLEGLLREGDPRDDPAGRASDRITRQLVWEADSTGLGASVRTLEGLLADPPEGRDTPPVQVRNRGCIAALGRVATGDPRSAEAHLARLHTPIVDGPGADLRPFDQVCAELVRGLAADARGDGDAAVRHALAVDSLLRAHPEWGRSSRNLFQQQCARILAAHGRPAEALAALRRREVINPAYGLAPILREEGRLAAQLGDTEGAIRAWSQYLRLRTDPDPELLPEVEEVRRELAALAGERPGS